MLFGRLLLAPEIFASFVDCDLGDIAQLEPRQMTELPPAKMLLILLPFSVNTGAGRTLGLKSPNPSSLLWF